MAAEEDLIQSFFNVPAIDGEITKISARLTTLKADLLAFQKSKVDLGGAFKVGDIVTGVNASNEAMAKFSRSTDEATAAIRKLKAEQIELKNEGIRLANAQKEAAIEAKKAAAEAKLASLKATEDGARKVLELREEARIRDEIFLKEEALIKKEKERLTSPDVSPEKKAEPTGPKELYFASNQLEQQAILLAKNKTAIAENAAQQKRLGDQLAAGTITQAKYDKEIAQAIILGNEYKLANKNLAASINNIQKEQSYEEGTFKKREAALGRLKQAYKELTPAQQAEPFAVRQLGLIQRLDTQVKGFSKTLGESQKNVGNYGGAFEKVVDGGKKAFSVLRNLANIIPGLGLSGIILLIAEPLIELGKSLIASGTKIDEFKEKGKALGEVSVKAGDAFAETSTKLKTFTDRIGEKNKTDAEQKRLISEVNDEYGKFGINIKNASDLEAFAVKQAPIIAEVFLLKAQAAAAYGLSVEQAKKALADKNGELDDVTSIGDKLSNGIVSAVKNLGSFINLVRGPGGGQGFLTAYYTGLDKDRNKNVEKEQAAANRFLKINEDLQKKITETLKKGGLQDDELAGQRAKEAAAAKAAQELADKKRAADLKSLKDTLEDQKKAAKELFDNELLLDSQRVEARQIQSDKEIAILNTQYQIDISSKTLTNKQKEKLDQDLSDAVLAISAKEESDIFILRTKSAAKQKQLDKDLNDQYNAAVKSRSELAKAATDESINAAKVDFERRSSELEKANAIELLALTKKRNAGTISEREYGQEREKILKNTSKFLLLAQLDFAEQNLKILKAGGLDVVKQEEEIAKLRLKVAEEAGKNISKKQQESADSAGDINAALKKFKEYYDQIQGVIDSALDASFNSQKNKIQELIDLNEEKKNKEIDAVNASSLSEQQKADKIAVINAKAAAEKERLELRQRELDRKRAEYDKAAKIAQIILNGAIAVTAQLSIPGPVGIAGAIFAGAIAAAQLAIAIATPIPKFKMGTKNAPEGLAIVGDGGRSEVVESGGRFSLTPDTPTLTYLKAGDKVHPDADAFMSGINNRRLSLSSMKASEGVDDRLLSAVNGLRHDVRSKPVPRIQNNQNGVKVIWANGNGRYKTWVNENMQS